MSTLEAEMLDIGRRAREAANTLRLASSDARTAATNAMAQRLRERAAEIVTLDLGARTVIVVDNGNS